MFGRVSRGDLADACWTHMRTAALRVLVVCAAVMAASVCQAQVAAAADSALPVSDSSSFRAVEAGVLEGDRLTTQEATQDMYRLYNMISGEHFFTANAGERDYLVSIGWFYEGVGWVAPKSSKTPVFRLYNPNAGDHHYTTSAAERDFLIPLGWSYEGIGWYSDDRHRATLLRAYNPNARSGTHHYMTSVAERDGICSIGWRNEGVGWYGVAGGRAGSMSLNYNHLQIIAGTVSSSGGIATQYGSISNQARSNIQNAMNTGTHTGFVAINARTGACVAHNADARMFSASCIKVATVAALCKYNAPGIAGWRTSMYNIITYSSNVDYNALGAHYGKWYLRRFAADAGVNLDLKYGNLYADITPRELCKLWIAIRDYICSNGPNVGLFKGLFGMGAYYKEGWMYEGMYGGQLYNMGGIQGDVVYGIMTRYARPDNRMWALKNAIVGAAS